MNKAILTCVSLIVGLGQLSHGQLSGGAYDFGLARQGERRGTWTPGEWLAVVLLLMTLALGLAVSIGLCYYVNKRRMQRTYSHPLVAQI